MTTNKIEKPVEIVVIDCDNMSVVLTHIYFNKILGDNQKIVHFTNYTEAYNYFSNRKNVTPKIILLETITAQGQCYSFLYKYQNLKRNDFVYIISVSVYKSDINRCLAYKFVRRYITKPLKFENVLDIANELKLIEE